MIEMKLPQNVALGKIKLLISVDDDEGRQSGVGRSRKRVSTAKWFDKMPQSGLTK